MATVIGDAAVRIMPDMRRFAAQMRAQMRSATSGMTRSMRATGTTMGRTLGDGFVRGADGRLRDAQGRFAAAGQQITRQMQGDMQRAGDAAARGFTGAMQGVTQSFQATGQTMATAGQTMTKSVTAPLGAIGATSITVAGDFQAAMNGVRAVSGAAGKDFTNLRNLAKRMGSTTQFSAVEAANAMEFLGMAGFKTTDIMAALPDVLSLAAAGNTDLATTADIASNIMSGFGIEASEMGRVADVMAATAAGANVDMRMLGESMKYAAPLARAAGWSFEDTAAAVGFLGNAGIQGSMAGTGLNSILATLADTSSVGGRRLKEFGVAAQGADGQTRPLVDIIEDLSTKGADVADVISIFGLEAGPKLQALIGQGSKGLEEFAKDLKNSEGAAKEMADIRMEGFVGQVKSLQSAFQGLMIEIGDAGLLDWATDFAQRITGLLSGLARTSPELMRIGSIVAIVAAVAGPALAALGFAITGISTALAVLLSPVALVVAAVAALGIAFVVAWRYSSTFRDGVRALADTVRSGAVAAFQQLRASFVTTLLPALQRLGQVVMQDLLPAFRALIQAVASRVIPIARQISSIFTSIVIPAIMKVYAAIVGALVPVFQALANFVRQRVIPAVQMIGDRLSELITKARPVIQVIAAIVTWLAQMAGRIIGTVVPILIRLAGPIFTALFRAIGMAIGFIGTLIGWLVTAGRAFVTLGRWVSWLWTTAIAPAFKFIGQAARLLATVLLVVVIAPIVIAVRTLGAIFGWLWRTAIRPAFQGIGAAARWLWQAAIRPVFTAVQAQTRVLAAVFRWLWTTVVRPVFRGIGGAIRTWWTASRAIFAAVTSFIRGPLGSVFRWLRDSVIRPVFRVIGSAITSTWQRRIRPAFTAVRAAVAAVAVAFRSARDGIRKAWEQLRGITRRPVNFIINTVYNKGIRAVWNAVVDAFGGKKLDPIDGLARGGILPGMSSWRGGDDQLVPMRRGEGVYVSEAMRDPYERARLHAVNRAAMAGRSLAPFHHMEGDGRGHGGGFALGGIFDGIGNAASAAWDKAKQGASWLKDTFGGAIKAGVKALIDPMISLIPGKSGFSTALKGGARGMVDRLLGAGDKGDKVVGKFVKPVNAAIGTRYGVPGKMWASGFHTGTDFPAAVGTAVRAALTGRVTSTSSAGPYGNHIRMSHAGGLTTLYAHLSRMAVDAGQSVTGGRRIGSVGSTGNSTGPHLHFEARRGGKLINPESLFDTGGWLMPGRMAYNGLSSPEAVLTPPQWRTLSVLAGRAAEGIETSRSLDRIMSGSGGSGAPAVTNVAITLENHGVIGSQRELDDWFTGMLSRAAQQRRLPAGLGGR
ncbi:phage tail tape measure protein [Streptomyces sp. 549]|uniref:phage tail tape measure protein n=1 Tax=Streptomyces sp. 549 TaxID=3049076 RepID=UPI0024C3E217|nr:phage tail tape measure protein [Streptomyces sp. 549]MDK1473613.1 phage tail tape measure protein [Streptomyces sp. 549]